MHLYSSLLHYREAELSAPPSAVLQAGIHSSSWPAGVNAAVPCQLLVQPLPNKLLERGKVKSAASHQTSVWQVTSPCHVYVAHLGIDGVCMRGGGGHAPGSGAAPVSMMCHSRHPLDANRCHMLQCHQPLFPLVPPAPCTSVTTAALSLPPPIGDHYNTQHNSLGSLLDCLVVLLLLSLQYRLCVQLESCHPCISS